MSEKQNVTQEESHIQILENGIRLAHKRGAYSMEETSQLLVSLYEVKKELTVLSPVKGDKQTKIDKDGK